MKGIIAAGVSGEDLAKACEILIKNEKATQKTVSEIIEEQNTIPITAVEHIHLIQLDFKDGKQRRRERRKAERKTKKK